MKTSINIAKFLNYRNPLTANQADVVLKYLISKDIKEISLKNVAHCTSAFLNYLILNYNRHTKFDRHKKLIFFNVKNPVVVLKIQEAQFNFFDKKTSKKYIKMHNKIMKEVLNS